MLRSWQAVPLGGGVGSTTGGAASAGGAAAAESTPPGTVVARRLNNGRLEVVYADGKIKWSAVDGGCAGTIYPDGSGTQHCASHVASADFPPLPADVAPWGEDLEQDLLGIVDTLLPDEDEAEYRVLFAGKDYYDRIDDHLSVIRILVRE